MKRAKSLIVLLISILSVCLAFAACGPEESSGKPKYSLDKTAVTLTVGETHQINIKASGGTKFTATYKSNTPGAASVGETGLVTAVAPGTAKITVKVDGSELTLNVTVEHKYELNKTTLDLTVGDDFKLAVKTTPNKNVAPVWSITPQLVATVSADGLVTAVAKGTATATAKVDGKTLTCVVNVEEAETLYTYTISQELAEMEAGQTLKLTLDCEPANDALVTEWGVDGDEGIVTVDQTGLVTAVGTGDVTVTASVDGAVVAECKIKVFAYEYEFPTEKTIDFGKTGERITVTVEPEKTIDFKFTVTGDAITVDLNGVITTVGVGTATVKIADGEREVGTCTVTVNPTITMAETLSLHVGDSKKLTVTVQPESSASAVVYAVTDGDDVVSVDNEGNVTALKNGSAAVKVTVGDKTLECSVTVADVFATEYKIEELEKGGRDNPIDLSGGAEYWEQYIAFDEINHKKYDTVAEDIITRTFPERYGTFAHYLPDYQAWLAWNGGAKGSDCSCGHCGKDTQNGGDDGWTDGGTKAYFSGENGSQNPNVLNSVYSFDIKVFPGLNTVKIYAGGFKMTGEVVVKVGNDIIGAAKTFTHTNSKADLVTVSVDAKTASTVTVVFKVTNVVENGFITFAGASVSGDVYRLNKYTTRVLPGQTDTISVTKNGGALGDNDNVTFVSSDASVVTVSNTGELTYVGRGTANINVTVNGRVRTCVVTAGYSYSLNSTSVSLLSGQTHQIVVTSEPTGSTQAATYTSNGTAVATVDTNGLITAVAEGETTVDVSVDGDTLSVKVIVAKAAVKVSDRSFKNNYIDFTGEEIVYWEYYLYNEITSPTDKTDIIEGNIDGKSGENNCYGAFINFTNGSPKQNSYDDSAWTKYSWGSSYEFTISVPAGHHELRIYTGAWENTINKVSLLDGDKELAAVTLEKQSGGRSTLVTFDTTTAEVVPLKVKIEAVDGNNCRLMAISVVDVTKLPTTAATTSVSYSKVEMTGTGESSVNLSEAGNLDWIKYRVQNHKGENDDEIRDVSKNVSTHLIGNVTGLNNNTGWDYKAAFTWDDGEIAPTDYTDQNGVHNNFVISDVVAGFTVDVNVNVKKITLYLSGWDSAYGIYAEDSKGNRLLAETVATKVNGQSKAYAVTLDITATEAETLTFKMIKLEGSNIGIAAIAVSGDAAPVLA